MEEPGTWIFIVVAVQPDRVIVFGVNSGLPVRRVGPVGTRTYYCFFITEHSKANKE